MTDRFKFMRRHLGIAVIGMLLAACSGAGATASPSVKPSEASATASPSPTAKATQAPTQAPTPAPTPAPTGSFHLEKTCEGFECTVTKSSLSALPIGTTISYSGPGMDSLTATVKVKGGTATGACNIATMPGACTFTATGTLAKMPSKVVVTQAGPIWMWDGDLIP